MLKFIKKLFTSLFYLIVVAIFCTCCYVLFNGLALGASRGVVMGSLLFTTIILSLSMLINLKK